VNADLAYGEPFGAAALRHRLAPFLARTRGIDAIPEQTGVFAGSTQALHVLASILREQGATRIAVEDPGHRWRTRALVQAGLEAVPVGVDERGLRVDDLPDDVGAVVVSPERHFPSGVQLAPERRRALARWAAHGGRLVIEHDYEGHLRYDRAPGASLQALAPEHVAYVGSASALLAPTLRLGWAVVPARLVVPVANRVFGTGIATPRITQLAFAELLERSRLERHLRRVRAAYRRRRTVAAALLPRVLPGAVAGGTPGGLFLHVALPDGTDEAALLSAARSRGITLDGVGEHALVPQPPGLAVGFAALPEPTLARALRALGRAADPAEVVRARSQLDSTEPHVVDNRDLRRYELMLGARLAGHVSYRLSRGVVVLTHTDLDEDLADEGHGETLVRGALDDVRRSGAKACPLVAAYVERHPEVRDLVAS
jgi:GntR family transcriptional regulator/MocR family aminotransferase